MAILKRGQIVCGRNRLADDTGLSPQEIRTSLQHLQKSHFLTIESTNLGSIITICKYDEYQRSQDHDQPTNQPAINQPSTNHQPLHNKGIREYITTLSGKPDELAAKDEKTNTTAIREIVEYLNATADKDFRWQSKPTQALIKARMKEGFDVEDFKLVIDHKVEKWRNAVSSDGRSMYEFLRPQTLFGTKFEAYLNEIPIAENLQKYS